MWAAGISARPPDGAGPGLNFIVTNTNARLFAVPSTVSPSGVLTFTPAANASGTATVTVALKDSGGGADTSSAQTFTITVQAVPDAPVGVADTATVTEDTTGNVIAVLANDADPDNLAP